MATLDTIRIDDEELARFGYASGYASRAHALLLQQRSTWEMARRGYAGLDQVRVRALELDGLTVRLQHNPGRLRSSAARVDARSIRDRPCFLCVPNLPEGQRGVPYGDDYVILVNPFPIFPEHLTIAALAHTPQLIGEALLALLDLGRDLSPRYTAFYNGPRCGASAPDHLHFQAGTTGFMPLDAKLPQLLSARGEPLGEWDEVRVTALDSIPCRCIAMESRSREGLGRQGERLLAILRELSGEGGEPMVNIIAAHDDAWRVLVFPRARHRPSFYAAQEGEGILLSPASVDLAGVFIAPREEDYGNIEADDIAAMLDEVCLSRELFGQLKRRLRAGDAATA